MTRRSFLTLACGVMVLSACGFQLRGQQDYPFKRLAVVGAPPPFMGRLSRMVQGGSDTVIVSATANADAVLHVSESRSVATLTLNAEGVVEEYQINYWLNYSLAASDGTQLIPPSTIALNRAMTYSDEYTQAKMSESDLLFADMQSDAVDQLMRRLGAVHTMHPAPGQGVPAVAPRAPLPPPPL